MKNLLTSVKSRLVFQLLIIISVPLTYGGYSFYQVHLKQVALEDRIQDMTEYEVCQIAFEEFGINMVKEMGCFGNIGAIIDLGE